MTAPGIYNIKALPSWKFIEKCDDAVTNRNGEMRFVILSQRINSER